MIIATRFENLRGKKINDETELSLEEMPTIAEKEPTRIKYTCSRNGTYCLKFLLLKFLSNCILQTLETNNTASKSH